MYTAMEKPFTFYLWRVYSMNTSGSPQSGMFATDKITHWALGALYNLFKVIWIYLKLLHSLNNILGIKSQERKQNRAYLYLNKYF